MGEERLPEMMPVISIVVLTYNHEEYIRKCIDSILAQKTTFPYEIVIADDCSTDRTVEIVREFYSDKIKLITREKNVGICRNIYEAYREIKGKYIFDCSGDDYLPSDMALQKHVDYLETHEDVFSVGSWILFVDSQKGVEKVLDMPYTTYTLLDFLRGVPVGFFLGAMRNEFRQDNVEYLCKVRDAEEFQMLYYCLTKGKKAILQEPLYAYCRRTNANNYNSTHSFADILKNYAQGLRAIESTDRGKHNFNVIKTISYAKPIDYMLQNEGVKSIVTILRILTFKETCVFVWIKLLMKLNHREMPEYLLKEEKLIKQGMKTLK